MVAFSELATNAKMLSRGLYFSEVSNEDGEGG